MKLLSGKIVLSYRPMLHEQQIFDLQLLLQTHSVSCQVLL